MASGATVEAAVVDAAAVDEAELDGTEVDCVDDVAGTVEAEATALDRTMAALDVASEPAPADLPEANSATSPAVDATLSPTAAIRARAAG